MHFFDIFFNISFDIHLISVLIRFENFNLMHFSFNLIQLNTVLIYCLIRFDPSCHFGPLNTI